LQERARQQHDLLWRYFKQEGLLDGVRCAAVDVGWLGTSRLMMNSILKRHGANDVISFYYGVRRDVFPPSVGRYLTYFKENELTTATTALLEHYYSASPYPTTIGYKEDDDGNVVPVYPKENPLMHTPITQANEEAVASITQMIASEGWHKETELLWAWAKQSMSVIMESNVAIDLTPLLKAHDFDDHQPFVRRLSLLELLGMVILGKSITAFDRASFCLSVPLIFRDSLWRVKLLTGRLRALLYLRWRYR
jgi:hypothetical protein